LLLHIEDEKLWILLHLQKYFTMKNKINIVFLDSATIGEDVKITPISSLGEYVSYHYSPQSMIAERIKNCNVVISNKAYVGQKEIDAAPKLKLICVAATGTNNVDIPYAQSKGIQVKNVVNYSTESVAQITFMHMLNLVCNAFYFDNVVKSGEYTRGNSYTDVSHSYYELKGKKLGIIGLGNIGNRVAEIATVFGMDVAYFTTSGVSHSEKYPAHKLNKLLNESDIVSIHAPLNEKTKDLINFEKMNQMKRTGYIINMSRGGIINEADLVKALNGNIIAGAAVDVYTQEPIPSDHPFFNVIDKSKLLFSPHIAWASKEARKILVERIAENIKSL